jgi:hypothetical protein
MLVCAVKRFSQSNKGRYLQNHVIWNSLNYHLDSLNGIKNPPRREGLKSVCGVTHRKLVLTTTSVDDVEI